MSDKGMVAGLVIVVVFNFSFNMVSFWILNNTTTRVNEMTVTITRLDRDRDLLKRIEKGEEFARTFCLDGKLKACGGLGRVKKR